MKQCVHERKILWEEWTETMNPRGKGKQSFKMLGSKESLFTHFSKWRPGDPVTSGHFDSAGYNIEYVNCAFLECTGNQSLCDYKIEDAKP